MMTHSEVGWVFCWDWSCKGLYQLQGDVGTVSNNIEKEEIETSLIGPGSVTILAVQKG